MKTTNRTARTSLLPILAVNFIGTLGFSIVLPFLVFLVIDWGGNAFIYGLIGATYSVFQLIGAPLLGRWSDRFGRKKILLLSQLGTLVSWLVFLSAFVLPVQPGLSVDSALFGQFTLTLPLVIVFLARAADGLTGGNVSVANAYLADVTEDADRNRNFGRMAASGNLGFILGPALAGLLGATIYGEVLPVVAAILISLVATIIIAWRLEESRPCTISRPLRESNLRRVFGQEQKECYRIEKERDPGLAGVLKLPRVPLLLAVYFLVMLGFSFYYVAFPTHAASGLGWTVAQAGTFFSVMSVLMVLVQGPLLGWLSDKVASDTLILVGGIILAAGFPVFCVEEDLVVYFGAALLALGNGLMWPSVLAVLSEQAEPEVQGAVQGIASSLGAVASIVGLVAGGLLYASLGVSVFVLSAVTILVTVPLAIAMRRPGGGSPEAA